MGMTKTDHDNIVDSIRFFRQQLLSDTPSQGDSKHAFSLNGAYNLQTQLNEMTDHIIDTIYPIGSIYVSTNPVMPTALTKGRTWSLLPGDYVLKTIESGTGGNTTAAAQTGENSDNTSGPSVDNTGAASGSTGAPSNNSTSAASGSTGGPSVANTGAASGSTGGPSNNTSGSTVLTTDTIPAHTHGEKAMTGAFKLTDSVGIADYNAGKVEGTSGVFSELKESRNTARASYGYDHAVTRTIGVNFNGNHTHNSVGGNQGHTHTLSNHTHSLNSHTHTLSSHTHSLNNHTHTLNNHTHSLNNHTHTLSNHTHTLNGHSHTTGMPANIGVYVWKRTA